MADMDIMIPLSIARIHFRARPPDGVLAVIRTSPKKGAIEAEVSRIKDALARRKDEKVSFYVYSGWLEMLKVQESFVIVRFYFALLGTSLLAVGLLGLVGMLVANVSGRLREIGIHRALGATRLRQAVEVLIQAAFVGFLGGLLGIALGIVVVHVYSGTQGTNLVVTRFWMASALFSSLFTALLAGLLPARAAMQIAPIEALRG